MESRGNKSHNYTHHVNEGDNSLQVIQLSTTSKPVIIIYPTIAPETVVIPIVCSIILFPIFVVTAICLLRYYNQRARAKDKFRCGMQTGAAAIFSLSKIGAAKSTNSNRGRGRLNKDRFRCMPELGLDTLIEEEKEISCEVSGDTPKRSDRNNFGILVKSSAANSLQPSSSSLSSTSSSCLIKNDLKKTKRRVTLKENLLPEQTDEEDEENGSSVTRIIITKTMKEPEDPDEITVLSSSYYKPLSVTKVKDLGSL